MKVTEQITPGKATIRPDHPVVAGSFTTITFTYTAGHPIDDSGYVKIAFRTWATLARRSSTIPPRPTTAPSAPPATAASSPAGTPRGTRAPGAGRSTCRSGAASWIAGKRSSWSLATRPAVRRAGGCRPFARRRLSSRRWSTPSPPTSSRNCPPRPTLRIVPGEPGARGLHRALAGAGRRSRLPTISSWRTAGATRPARRSRSTHPGFAAAGVHTVTADRRDDGPLGREQPDRGAGRGRAPASLLGRLARPVGRDHRQQHHRGLFCLCPRLWPAGHRGAPGQRLSGDGRVLGDGQPSRRGASTSRAPLSPFPATSGAATRPWAATATSILPPRAAQIAHSCTDLLPGKPLGLLRLRPRRRAVREPARAGRARGPLPLPTWAGAMPTWRMHDPEIELAVEVHSAWGTFEWLVEDALRRGYRIGICANSDGHKGRPGASYPGAGEFGSSAA